MQHAWIWKYRGLGNGIRCAAMAIVLLCMVCSCDRPIRNQSLKSFSELLSEKNLTAEKASDIRLSLENISADSLNEAERNFRSFLIIKAADKAYIPHSNDTAYLAVKDYFSKHHEELYQEVLYYGGRVYSDIGDYPTALRHFNEALEKLDDSEKNLALRATINSQTGQLLNKLCIYDQAQQYIRAAIEIEKATKDSINLMYDYNTLGYILLHQGMLQESKESFNASNLIEERLNSKIANRKDSVSTNNESYLSYIYSRCNDNESALKMIRKALETADSLDMPTVYRHAIMVYLDAGIPDTAYYYAHRLTTRQDPYGREFGYEMMLSPSLIHFVDADSIPIFFAEYKDLLDSYYNDNQNRAALIQNTSYNYSIHDRDRKAAEDKNIFLMRLIIGAIVLVLLAVVIIIYQKYRYQKKLLSLYNGLDNVELLNKITLNKDHAPEMTERENTIHQEDQMDKEILPALSETNDQKGNEDEYQKLKTKLDKELDALISKSAVTPPSIPPEILQSKPYRAMLEKIRAEDTIEYDNALWKELETEVLLYLPNIKYNLNLLSGGILKEWEYQMLLLIRCGMNSSQIAQLIGRRKSAISYRREKISNIMFGKKLDAKTFDTLIRLI